MTCPTKARDGFQIRFDGPPSHESGRFIEVEDLCGKSIRLGKWVKDDDYWLLRIPTQEVEALEDAASQEDSDEAKHERFQALSLGQVPDPVPEEVVQEEALSTALKLLVETIKFRVERDGDNVHWYEFNATVGERILDFLKSQKTGFSPPIPDWVSKRSKVAEALDFVQRGL